MERDLLERIGQGEFRIDRRRVWDLHLVWGGCCALGVSLHSRSSLWVGGATVFLLFMSIRINWRPGP